MTPALLMTNDETLTVRTESGEVTAIGAGALRYRDGYFGGSKAALIEEGTTNLVGDPTVNSGTFGNGWAGGAKDGTFGHDLGRSYKATSSGGSFTIRPHNNRDNAPISSQTLTRSIWAYIEDDITGVRRVTRTDPDGSFVNVAVPSSAVTTTNAWVRLIDTFTVAAAQTNLRDYWIESIAGVANGANTWWTETQIEEKDHATSFCPEFDGSGNLLPGYAWTGTAHNSPSTRAAASITIPYAGPVGSVACWYSEDFGATWNFHYAPSLGAIGTYGDISSDGGGNLVITSQRALLLGPLAVFTGALTSGEQSDLQALTSMWTWTGIGGYSVTVPPQPEPVPVISPLPSIASPQAALDARSTDTRGVLYIGGVLTPYVGARADFKIGDTATGQVTIPLPRPSHIVHNAAVEWQSGHNDFVGTTFSGFVPDLEFAMTAQGDTLDLMLVGWKHLLTEPFRDDLIYPGPVDARDIFIDLCERAGVPAYIAEAALTPSGSPLMLGGNVHVDDGDVVIRANTSPIGQFERLVEPYGYYVTDVPMGPVVLHRVLGVPSETPVATFREGIHLGDTRRQVLTQGIVNVWDVRGATFEDAYGGEVPIRSIADPDSVPPHPDIPIRGGYRYRQKQNSDLVRQDLADAAREALEIEHAAADTPVRWRGVGVPGIAPGDAVAVDAETVEAAGTLWLVSLVLTDDDGGLMGDYRARAGAGEARPGIVDRTEIPVFSGPVHLGDEHVPWYAVPSPEGLSKQWPITLPQKASTVNVRGISHSWNSQLIDGANKDLNVSKWEVWEPGVDQSNKDNRPVASGTMPVQNEDYLSRPNFKDFRNWSPFAINLSRIDAGDYLLKFVCGENRGAGHDDGELAQVYLELFGLLDAAGA